MSETITVMLAIFKNMAFWLIPCMLFTIGYAIWERVNDL